MPLLLLLFRSDRKSTRLNSSHTIISYAVFCLKKTIRLFTFLILSPTRVALKGRRTARTALLAHLRLFFFNDTATTEIYTLSLHDALPICTRLNSSHTIISYAVFRRV